MINKYKCMHQEELKKRAKTKTLKRVETHRKKKKKKLVYLHLLLQWKTIIHDIVHLK